MKLSTDGSCKFDVSTLNKDKFYLLLLLYKIKFINID